MSVGPNKKPDSEANNNNNEVPPEKTNGTKANGETSNKENGAPGDPVDDAASTEATPKPRISRTKRRRRGPRPSHRKWEEEIMPEGNLTGLFDSDISDQEEEGEEETPEEKPKGSEEWATAKIPDEDLESLTDDSPSRLEWLRQKKDEGQTNEHLDSLMSMVGLEAIKAHFLDVKQRVEAAKRWGEDMKTLKLDLIMTGRDGTGKAPLLSMHPSSSVVTSN